MADWIAKAEESGCGPLALTPEQLWRTTPAELDVMAKGYNWRQERQRERDAWMVWHIMAPHVAKKDRPSIEDLLGRTTTTPEEAHNALFGEDKHSKFDALWQRVEQKRKVEGA